jgi:hypothetical protein
MAILEIEIGRDEQARLQQEAQSAGVSMSEWARRRLFGAPPVTFTTDDGEVYVIPDLPADLGRATALASEQTLRKFWDTPEEEEAWRSM